MNEDENGSSMSEEQRVVDYLNRLMAGRFFSIEDLDDLTSKDLQIDTPVQDINKEILETTLAKFRKQYKSAIFRD